MFAGLRQKLFGGNGASKSSAKSRLHFVLVQDRAGLTNEEMTDFKRQLMDVIERFFVVQERGFDIDYKREGDTTTLLINSPVVVKRHHPLELKTQAAADAPKTRVIRKRRRRRVAGRAAACNAEPVSEG